MTPNVTPVRELPDTTWAEPGPTHDVEAWIESGEVLSFPRLPFVLADTERRFLDPRWADGKAKNVSVRWPANELRGAAGDAADLAGLQAMIVRYADQSGVIADPAAHRTSQLPLSRRPRRRRPARQQRHL